MSHKIYIIDDVTFWKDPLVPNKVTFWIKVGDKYGFPLDAYHFSGPWVPNNPVLEEVSDLMNKFLKNYGCNHTITPQELIDVRAERYAQ